MIRSDTSPVGIDAVKTHIYIIHKLEQIEKRLDALEIQLNQVEDWDRRFIRYGLNRNRVHDCVGHTFLGTSKLASSLILAIAQVPKR